MDIDVKFGQTTYTFHSKQDVAKAQELYQDQDQEQFETLMEDNQIDFEISLWDLI